MADSSDDSINPEDYEKGSIDYFVAKLDQVMLEAQEYGFDFIGAINDGDRLSNNDRVRYFHAGGWCAGIGMVTLLGEYLLSMGQPGRGDTD